MTGKKKTTEKKKPSSKKTASKKNTGAPRDRHVTIRMYNVGFGDAFLALLPDGDGQRRILFDCGSIEAAPGLAMSSVVDRIISDVTDPNGVPSIDVVVATHRHKDHVSGFGLEAWDRVQVKEVWMPWTEDRADEEARRIRDVQSRLAVALTNRLAALSAEPDEELSRYKDIVANSLWLTNDRAMETLHYGFSGNPKRRFLSAKPGGDHTSKTEKSGCVRTLETDALPGVKVHILGPSRNPDIIRDMNPPKGESYLRVCGTPDANTGLPPAPFPARFRLEDYEGAGTLVEGDMEKIERAGAMSDPAIAVALDQAVNGTSLMLMLEISGAFLLFPGDAQWGTWKAVMEDPEWREMLRRVKFYKIGHHGSHNATPIDFVEKMIPDDGICAMASTLTRRIWPEIPKEELLTGLAAKHASIARSDQPKKVGKVFRVDEGVIEAHIPY
jgi:beta-lactamase superfamily II metal-dependent hydrolase